ncbi:DUF4232 domain-containing protein [Micromonospora sp. Llam7]|uniref:DUF4232 domain-containing protein n=1 Tax=Micromonospora tarapacensis TaxID=2835305 RepID=UPI001C839EA9|nr:DUF4232 domain-containing protein [Micromonospora tarapacensis]MBX7264983.1 DUF4232 domain-containing protein [Micromonospora tarapacensis]
MPGATAERHGGVPAGNHRRLTLALAGIVLLGGCAPADVPGSPVDRPPAPAQPPAAPDVLPPAMADPPAACPDSGVRMTYLGVSAAMGLRAMGVELVNCGDRPYRLNGYPAPQLRDADGNPIPVRVIDGAKGITSGFDDPPRPLVLAPGEAAGTALLWRNLVDDPTVVATNAEHLAVAPLPGRPAQDVAIQGRIDLGNTDRLGVSAWKKREPTTPRPIPESPTPPPTTAVPLL